MSSLLQKINFLQFSKPIVVAHFPLATLYVKKYGSGSEVYSGYRKNDQGWMVGIPHQLKPEIFLLDKSNQYKEYIASADSISNFDKKLIKISETYAAFSIDIGDPQIEDELDKETKNEKSEFFANIINALERSNIKAFIPKKLPFILLVPWANKQESIDILENINSADEKS